MQQIYAAKYKLLAEKIVQYVTPLDVLNYTCSNELTDIVLNFSFGDYWRASLNSNLSKPTCDLQYVKKEWQA